MEPQPDPTCPRCGRTAARQAAFCSDCGAAIHGVRWRPPSWSEVLRAALLVVVAALVGLVGGGLALLFGSDYGLPFGFLDLLPFGVAAGCCVAAGRLPAGRFETSA